jgi:hypothetical protein
MLNVNMNAQGGEAMARDGAEPRTPQAALGIAAFLAEDYVTAVGHLEKAIEIQPDEHLVALLQRARANARARVDELVPKPHLRTRHELLSAPYVPPGVLPPPQPPLRLGDGIFRLIGNVLGSVITGAIEALTTVVGLALPYKGRVWTNWYRRPEWLAVLTLAHMRNLLNKHNLITTYPKGRRVAFLPSGLEPPQGVSHFRTADGSWNNLDDPKEGAAGTRFPRNVAYELTQPETESGDLIRPNPREVSLRLLTRDEPMKEVAFLNMLAAVWINFQNHDWISHGDNLASEYYSIPLAPDDPVRLRFGQEVMRVPKTRPDPTYGADGDEPAKITFINEVTHWWDGSQIYGSDQTTQDRVRSHVDGKMRLLDDGRLPLDGNGIEITGFTRNWWAGLAMFHSLFAQEHNKICDMLKMNHPACDDSRLFNVARLINAAVMAKIHSVEWTPAILPNRTLSDGLNANWYGLLTNLLHQGTDRKTVAPINIRNPEMGGVVGNPINKHGSPFGLTQEFVEVYRLHSLLPERLQIRRLDRTEVTEVDFPSVRQAGSSLLTGSVPMADLFYSFGVQQPGRLVLNNFPRFFQELSIPGYPVFDLAAVDILRARERGVPRYNQFRRALGLNAIGRFEDLTDDATHIAKLKAVYGDDRDAVERLDLLIGTLAEGTKQRPTHFGFGETLFQIFILNATRRLQADRFYTDNYNDETYTKEGLDWIDQTDFKTVILRHYPQLADTGLGNIKNAFEPWDTDRLLDLDRHPLRGFDRSLRPDPRLGDRYRDGKGSRLISGTAPRL